MESGASTPRTSIHEAVIRRDARAIAHFLQKQPDCVLQQDLDMPELLLPVPMTRKAVRRRGFNQSAYIARLVGRRLKIKVGLDVVHKTRETHRQSTLSRSQRQQNIAGVFALTRSMAENRVVIVDDVVTSCSTVAELARVIKAAGANEVNVWACARTPA